MTIRLYLETNFLLSHAHGRDPATSRLIAESWPDLQVGIPTCCVMEALTNLEAERKRINQRVGQNQAWIGELTRNRDSPYDDRLASLCSAVKEEWQAKIKVFENRLKQAIEWSVDPSRVSRLETDFARFPMSDLIAIDSDPTDHLILQTILGDAQEHPEEIKILLTENRVCFHDDSAVRQILSTAGIRYFPSATIFLKWYEAGAEF